MTRDEAKQTFTVHTNGSDRFIKIDKRTFDKFIDMIYDDIESRTCSNCNFYQKEVCCNSDSPLCTEFTSAEFGCIEFVRTKND